MIFNSEVNAMQNIDTGLWSVFRLEWPVGYLFPKKIMIAENIQHEEVDKWLAWGNLQR